MTDRRDFIRTLSAAAMGVGLQPLAPSPYPRAPSRKLDRIGLQLYTVRHEMEKDVAGTIAKVAAAGYQEVEFAGYFGKAPAEVKAMLDHHGLTAPSAHLQSLAPDQWRASLDAAKTIGHQYVVMPFIPAEQRKTLDDFKRIAQDFNRVAAQARDAGLQFAYHNHDFEFVRAEGRLPYDVLLEETDPTLVQLEIDLYWITKGGQDPPEHRRRSYPSRIHRPTVRQSDRPTEAIRLPLAVPRDSPPRPVSRGGEAGSVGDRPARRRRVAAGARQRARLLDGLSREPPR